MTQRTYTARVIVIRKTKLGESDLILTMLAEDGRQMRAVAKGARKPTSPFASRLELFSCADALFAAGRNLDIVSEVRLVDGFEAVRCDYDLSVAAAPIAELLWRITECDLESPRLFPLTHAALSALCRATACAAPLICAAHLIKALSFAGFKPSLDTCVCCGESVSLARDRVVHLSYPEGGVVCASCSRDVECMRVEPVTLLWARTLLYARFADILSFECDSAIEVALLRFCQQWTRYHVGSNLKSLNFLLANGTL